MPAKLAFTDPGAINQLGSLSTSIYPHPQLNSIRSMIGALQSNPTSGTIGIYIMGGYNGPNNEIVYGIYDYINQCGIVYYHPQNNASDILITSVIH